MIRHPDGFAWKHEAKQPEDVGKLRVVRFLIFILKLLPEQDIFVDRDVTKDQIKDLRPVKDQVRIDIADVRESAAGLKPHFETTVGQSFRQTISRFLCGSQ